MFVIITVPILFYEQDNLVGGQFWTVGRFDLLGEQNNLLSGQMSTQLTCYLPLPRKELLNCPLSKLILFCGGMSKIRRKQPSLIVTYYL